MGVSTDMLAAFTKVAELASVSAAAQDLGLPKSVVSKRIAQLEHLVQATLFARSTRRIALTSAGVVYLEFARTALESMRKAEERLRDLRQELTGEIRLTAPVSWGQRVLAPVAARFLAQYPGIEIDLVLDDRRLDLAYEGFDIALRMSPSHPPEMMAVPLYELEWRLCASPAYLAAGGTPQAPSDLQAHPCISYWRVSSDQEWVLRNADETVKVRVAGPLRANNPEAVAQAALSGMGIALLPLYICQADIAAGRLESVLTDWQPQTKFGDMIFAVAPIERMRLSRNKCFLEFLKDQLGTRISRPRVPS